MNGKVNDGARTVHGYIPKYPELDFPVSLCGRRLHSRTEAPVTCVPCLKYLKRMNKLAARVDKARAEAMAAKGTPEFSEKWTTLMVFLSEYNNASVGKKRSGHT